MYKFKKALLAESKNHLCRLTFTIGIAIAATAVVSVSAPLPGAAPRESAEQPVAEACSPDRFPTAGVNIISCCQDGKRTWSTSDGETLVVRVLGASCTEADGVGTNCGEGTLPFLPCTYGPCGVRIDRMVRAEEVHIFQPFSKQRKCGWQVNNVRECVAGCDWPAGVVREYPEPFLDQQEYGGLTGTCPYRRCLVGGIPAE